MAVDSPWQASNKAWFKIGFQHGFAAGMKMAYEHPEFLEDYIEVQEDIMDETGSFLPMPVINRVITEKFGFDEVVDG